MSFRLVEKGWRSELHEALKADGSALRMICPFIKRAVVEDILNVARPKLVRIITRFDCCAFYQGVSDLAALRLLIDNGASVRGVKNVHAKLYLIGNSTAIVTSANLTAAALDRNAEFGFVANDEIIWRQCAAYFETMWTGARADLLPGELEHLERIVDDHEKQNGRTQLRKGLPDLGVDLGISPNEAPCEAVATLAMPPQAFVKFWGLSGRKFRLDRSVRVIDEVSHAGSHLACTHPKRPRSVKDGAVIFMGRMVRDPNDIIIDGRAIARKHDPDLDIATDQDIQRRRFRAEYPYLVRVESPEFIDGIVGDGVSLYTMMDELKSNSFRSTKDSAALGLGSPNPRKAYSQKSQIELSEEGFAWINSRLEAAFERHGKIPPRDLDAIESRPVPILFPDAGY